MANDVEQKIEDEIDRAEGNNTKKRSSKTAPTYRVIGDTRLPVSKAHGTVWNTRRRSAMKTLDRQNIYKAWDECLSYYRHDQTSHRQNTDAMSSGNLNASRRMHDGNVETENIVFANTTALVPAIYAKNPDCNFTAVDPADQSMAVQIQRLINRLLSKRHSPGINAKTKVRKSVVLAELMNEAYVEVGYTMREASSEQAMQEIADIAEKLGKAKTPQDVNALEGRLMALEDTVDVLRPSGPWAKVRAPHDIVIDPDTTDDGLDDAKWLMIRDYVPTAWLNARFAEQKNGQYHSVYKPTHILNAKSRDGDGDDVLGEDGTFSLFDDDADEKSTAFGYPDQDSFRRAQRTEVWYVWDRTTMRVLMFLENDWTWPVWVWDDPYKFEGFFPIARMQYYTDPLRIRTKGEVTYYLDQQDGLNDINNERAMARRWARRNIFFDKNRVNSTLVEQMLKGDTDTAIGVDLQEGQALDDAIKSMVPPSMQHAEIFDKSPLYEAISRISSAQPVMLGVEFKTNTTNGAIDTYNSVQQTRLDERIDAVEEFIGNIAWMLAQLALQFMDQAQVAALIGEKYASGWTNLSYDEISSRLQMEIAGGSTRKPTSSAMKQQSLQLGQILGQFVNAAPVPVLTALLENFRKSFGDVVPDEEWQAIIDAVTQQAAPAGPEGGAPGGAASGGGAGEEPASSAEDVIAQVETAIDQLPAEAKQALGLAMSRGVPMREALTQILQQLSGEEPVQ